MPFSSCRALDTPVSSVYSQQSVIGLRANLLKSVGLKHNLNNDQNRPDSVTNQSLPEGGQQRRDWLFIKPQTELQEGQGRTNLQCCGARSSGVSNTCSEQCSLGWHRTPRGKTQCPCTKQVWTMAFNPTNNASFKTKIFLLYRRPKPKWITHNDLAKYSRILQREDLQCELSAVLSFYLLYRK